MEEERTPLFVTPDAGVMDTQSPRSVPLDTQGLSPVESFDVDFRGMVIAYPEVEDGFEEDESVIGGDGSSSTVGRNNRNESICKDDDAEGSSLSGLREESKVFYGPDENDSAGSEGDDLSPEPPVGGEVQELNHFDGSTCSEHNSESNGGGTQGGLTEYPNEVFEDEDSACSQSGLSVFQPSPRISPQRPISCMRGLRRGLTRPVLRFHGRVTVHTIPRLPQVGVAVDCYIHL